MRPLALALCLLLSAACQSSTAAGSPLPPGELAFGTGLVAGPSVGLLLNASQRFYHSPKADLRYEAELIRQDLGTGTDFKGRTINGVWSQVKTGIEVLLPWEDGDAWTFRAGVTWLRADGDPVFTDVAGDYGGAYLGFGVDHRIGEKLVLAPDLEVLPIFEESAHDRGVAVQLALRLLWLP